MDRQVNIEFSKLGKALSVEYMELPIAITDTLEILMDKLSDIFLLKFHKPYLERLKHRNLVYKILVHLTLPVGRFEKNTPEGLPVHSP